jgi:hypothetical protein
MRESARFPHGNRPTCSCAGCYRQAAWGCREFGYDWGKSGNSGNSEEWRASCMTASS